MATCSSLSSLFEKPMPENPTLMESLSSMNQILPKNPLDNTCFTEIFGELHFQEKHSNSIHPAPPPQRPGDSQTRRISGGIRSSLDSLLVLSKNNSLCPSIKSSEKLQLCTERLGSESSDDLDDLVEEVGGDQRKEKEDTTERNDVIDGGNWNSCSDVRRKGVFPPPISSIGKTGKPWIYFKAYRQDGRFVMREVTIANHEFLHASREDGRLKLQLVLPGEGIPEGAQIESVPAGEEMLRRKIRKKLLKITVISKFDYRGISAAEKKSEEHEFKLWRIKKGLQC